MKQYLFVFTATLLMTACGSSSPSQPPADFLDTPLAARSTGQTASCYRLRQLLVAERAIGYRFQWQQLDEDSWERLDTLPSTNPYVEPTPDYRRVFRRTGDLIYLAEAAHIQDDGGLLPADAAKWTETNDALIERNPDITPIPGCG